MLHVPRSRLTAVFSAAAASVILLSFRNSARLLCHTPKCCFAPHSRVQVLQRDGEGLDYAWAPVMRILRAAAESADADEQTVQSAFESVQLLAQDFAPYVPEDILVDVMRTVLTYGTGDLSPGTPRRICNGSAEGPRNSRDSLWGLVYLLGPICLVSPPAGAQRHEINTALSAVSLLWNIADFVGRLGTSGSSRELHAPVSPRQVRVSTGASAAAEPPTSPGLQGSGGAGGVSVGGSGSGGEVPSPVQSSRCVPTP